jgi:hypothetical protein
MTPPAEPTTDDEFDAARAAALDAILASEAPLKLIVAGPGTGKTYTFERLIDQTEGRVLAITFLLGLVRELETSLDADVYSFHGFARRLLHSVEGTGVTHSVRYFPPLVDLVTEDIRIVSGSIIGAMDLGALFRNLAEDEPMLQSALTSGAYYDAVSHDDSVFRVLRAIESDAPSVPRYAQVLVDEFQDFCPLEVAFINALASQNPTLIVGDDDQALYAFRDASPDAIRALASGENYSKFELPFCTRCTSVIVESTHSVVDKAQAVGLLAGRLDKSYLCYMPEKRSDSETYPKIIHARCSVQSSRAPYVGQYIEQAINAISPEDVAQSHDKKFPTVLIIGPNPFLSQVETYLRQASLSNIIVAPKAQPELDLLDAYRMLVSDPDSNLGWRVLLQVLEPDNWEEAVSQGLGTGDALVSFLTRAFRDRHLSIASLVGRADDGGELTNEDQESLATALNVSVAGLAERLSPTDPPADEIDETQPTIMLTSLMGSKGLQASHVFIVGVNGGHFPRDNANISNEEVCQLLVALTRTRKSCTVASVRHFGSGWLDESKFVQWLSPHIELREVNREFFDATN